MKPNKIILASLVCLALMGTACKHKIKPVDILPTARIDSVELYSGGQQMVYSGKVFSETEANLSFRVAGTIDKMPYKEGAFVKKGAVVAQLLDRDYRTQLSATEAEYNEVIAMVARVKELYNRNSATQTEYEKAVSGSQQITAKYNHHKDQLADTRLRAPFDGYVQKHIYEEGETIGAGMPVITMIGKGDLTIHLNLSVQDFARKEHFKSFEAMFSIAPDKKIPLSLMEISPAGNANQLYTMILKINNREKLPLAVGMSAEVLIQCDTKEETLYRIPLTAIFEKEGKSAVWIFTSEKDPLQARTIEVKEVRKDGFALVSTGVKSGEKIVSSGVHAITAGMKVKPLIIEK
ncbi:MAG: efflux RND transporter periplasmic adaptor subunit [Bacteroidales bacterium]|jgi:RND family efflux transporter MFP subunit|nr:efflux RND transporter periplasmic adaptor subunit [Bacteroidales bacterium]